jgi:hypothetical protein
MLLTESDKARLLRGAILNIVIDVVGKKAGGSPKYINQRDDTYLLSLFAGQSYKKEFIDALTNHVDMGNFKYTIYTDKIYKSIFKEHSREYRTLLNLAKKEDIRNTMYSEVLTTISMYETGLANELKKKERNYLLPKLIRFLMSSRIILPGFRKYNAGFQSLKGAHYCAPFKTLEDLHP